MIIGYGNVMRGDDGAGPAGVDLLRSRDPTTAVIAVQTLVPELAPMLAGAAVVVFVDASVTDDPGRVRVEPIAPDAAAGALGHALRPSALALARELYGRAPRALQVSIGAAGLEPGAQLSPPVAAAVPSAAHAAIALVEHCTVPRA